MRSIHHKADFAKFCFIPGLEGYMGFDGECDRHLKNAIARARQIMRTDARNSPLTSDMYAEERLSGNDPNAGLHPVTPEKPCESDGKPKKAPALLQSAHTVKAHSPGMLRKRLLVGAGGRP